VPVPITCNAYVPPLSAVTPGSSTGVGVGTAVVTGDDLGVGAVAAHALARSPTTVATTRVCARE
jgi:hypothetical protein